MNNPERIPGAEEIRRRLPEGWRWFYFDTLLDFQLRRVSDSWEAPRFDGSLLLCDESETWFVRLTMKNVSGKLELPLAQKISGLDIEDATYSRGYEKTVRWRIADFENLEFSIYCEELSAELLPPPERGERASS